MGEHAKETSLQLRSSPSLKVMRLHVCNKKRCIYIYRLTIATATLDIISVKFLPFVRLI